MGMGHSWNEAMNIEDAVDSREPPPRLAGEEIARMMESACDAEVKAHVLLEELGEDAFIDALRARGYVVTEAE